jgi:sodium pump decarboxylase gamma subunit
MKGALRMKHKIFVLGVMICSLLGLSACGAETTSRSIDGSRYHPELFTQNSITDAAVYFEDDVFETWYLNGVTPENFEQQVYFNLAMKFNNQTGELTFNDENYKVYESGYDSWYKSITDIGYNSLETLQQDVNVTDVQYELNDDGVLVIDATVEGTIRSAILKIYMGNDFNPTDIGVTVNRSTGEKLENAGLNTLLGMGMAFAILIIISLIISLFPILFNGNRKKKESDQEITQKAIENTTAQIADKEDVSNDAELVAVIAAAIAAYEGSGSTDGFRVRSIRKVNTNWKKNR